MRAIAAVMIGLIAAGAATPGMSEDGKTVFTAFDYQLLPDWCETVVVRRQGQPVAELVLGEVFRSTAPGDDEFSFACKQPGFGGVGRRCETASLLLMVYGLNIEGEKERKLSTLCIR